MVEKLLQMTRQKQEKQMIRIISLKYATLQKTMHLIIRFVEVLSTLFFCINIGCLEEYNKNLLYRRFQVVLSNDEGSVESSCTLTVKIPAEKPTIKKGIEDQFIAVGKPLEIIIEVHLTFLIY